MKKRHVQEIEKGLAPAWHILFLGVVVFQIALLWAFFQKFPFSGALLGLSQLINSLQWPTLAAIVNFLSGIGGWMLLLGVAFILGQALIAIIKPGSLSALAQSLLSLVLGFTVLGLFIFGLGIAGFFKPVIFWIFTIVVIAGGGIWQWRLKWPGPRSAGEALEVSFFQGDRLVLRFFLAAFFLLPVMMAFVPEIFYDSLVYHLGLPHLYLLEGRYVDTPFVHFSRFPQLTHMIYVYALGLGGDTLAKFVHVSFFLAGILAIFAVAEEAGRPKAGLIAALLCVSIPVVQMNVWTTAVDFSLSVFALCSMLCVFIWHKKEEPAWRLLIVSGILGGAAFGTKYTGAFFLFGMAGFIAVSGYLRRWPLRRILASLFVWGAVVTVLMLPWFSRNAVFTGNPFYPFLSSLFPSKDLVVEKFASEAQISLGYTPRSFWGWLALPWTLALGGPSAFDFFGPAVVAFLPFVFAVKLESRLHWPWIALLGICFAAGLPFSRQARYLLPGVSILAVFSGIGMFNALFTRKTGIWKFAGQGIFMVCLAALLGWNAFIIHNSYAPYAVLSGREPRNIYTSYYHPGMNPWPPDMIYEDIAKLDRKAKIIFMGEEKVFRCPRPFVYSNVYDKTPMVEMANAAAGPSNGLSEAAGAEELYNRLKSQGITHILVNLRESLRIKNYGLFPWTSQGMRIFRQFWRRHVRIETGREVDRVPTLLLFSIKTDQEAASTKEFFPPILADALGLRPK